MNSRRVLAGLLAVGVLGGCTRSAEGGGFELIPRVPSYVLTAEDIAARVQRSPRELGLQLGGVRVAAVLVERGRCAEVGPCHATHLFADASGTRMRAELVDAPAALEVGRTYVLYGSVEATNAVPERWILRGHVLAAVR